MTPSFGTVRIDGADPVFATLHREQLWETIHSKGPRWDPQWRHVDKAGHPHTYGPKGSTPTLDVRREQQPCDGTCGGICEGEGYGVTVFTCPRCGEQIEPGLIPGPHVVTIPKWTEWRLEVEGRVGGVEKDGVITFTPGDSARHAIDFSSPDGCWIGTVVADASSASGDRNGVRWTTVVHGISELEEVAR